MVTGPWTHLTYNNDKPWFTTKLRQLHKAKEDAYRKGDIYILVQTGQIHTGKLDQSGKEELFWKSKKQIIFQ